MSDKSPDRIISYDPSPDDDSVLQQDQPYPAVDPVARLAVQAYSIRAARVSGVMKRCTLVEAARRRGLNASLQIGYSLTPSGEFRDGFHMARGNDITGTYLIPVRPMPDRNISTVLGTWVFAHAGTYRQSSRLRAHTLNPSQIRTCGFPASGSSQ